MPKKARTGRPPLAPGEGREARLFCRLLKTEIAEIDRAAKAAGQTRSEFIRFTLLEKARGKLQKGSAPTHISAHGANLPEPQDAGQQQVISEEKEQEFLD